MTVEAINIKPLVIQAGKRYAMRYGGITGVIKTYVSETAYVWFDGYNTFTSTGKFRTDFPEHSLDLIREYTQPEPLTFELKVGEKYETQLPSGEAGPVVELCTPDYFRQGWRKIAPFTCRVGVERYVTKQGELFDADDTDFTLRIVRPYVEPKPPTNAEKLEAAISLLANPRKDDEAFALIRGVIADLKASVNP